MDPAEMQLAEDARAMGDREQDQIDAEMHASSVHEVEARLRRLEEAIAERVRVADERERAADERERIADERERIADEREWVADQRERLADEREQRINDLETRVDVRARSVGLPTETIPERVLETIVRGRALLAASSSSLDRSQAAIERHRERMTRHQETIDREASASSLELDEARGADPVEATDPRDRGDQLRKQVVAEAAALAQVEDHIADFYESFDSSDPQVQARHVEIAEEARAAAQRARDTGAQFD